ncbi:DUF4179 domain-containing protein [Paenibacillus ginsengarvi]|uniref:DUF4179 domain-containing protein n=1 Tax=Paenibacillus ginsengarvi TaxID=400777 RepID=A0A3B0CRZ8_9BACL|nr:DUF4179 domain-containing protein [Paenibacillus ginsengarvi]RKN86209.1 DUF4179 domain-containing protein [Paenibacillus ginsengarvi]
MKDKKVDQELKLLMEGQAAQLPDVVRQRVDQTLSSLPAADVRTVPAEVAPSRTRRRTWRIALGAAVLLFIVGIVSVFTVPSLAERIRSLFTRDNIDIGLLRAQEFGLVQHPNIKVKDKGYTVKIDEVVADPTRVVLALQLFGPDGRHDRNSLVFLQENQVTIKDDKGRIVGSLYDYGLTPDFYYLVAFFPEPLQTDSISLEGRLTQLGNDIQKIPVTRGDWSFRFSVDMKEAKKHTKETPFEGSYTSPDGMTIRLKRLTQMVQGVRLEMETQLSEEALSRSPGELWKKQMLKFHFEDAEENEIHSVNTTKTPHMDSLMSHIGIPGDKPGLMHWSFTFQYLPHDQPYRFVFDGYSIPETDGTSIEFEPAKLIDQPITFRSLGDELILRKFTVESPPDTNGNVPEGALHVNGSLRNEKKYSEYVMLGTDGKQYTVTGRGTSSGRGSGWKDQEITLSGSRPELFYQFRMAELPTIPDKLILKRTVVDRLYNNVDWALPGPVLRK